MLASCTTKDPVYAKILSTDVKEIDAEALSPQTVEVKLTADGEWYVYTPSWIKTEPESGNGDTQVKIIINPNTDSYQELNAPRKDVVAFCGAKEKAVIKVSQKGENGLASERKYSKITKADEFELAKGYLIVFNTGSSLVAAAPLKTEVDNPKSYAFMPVGKIAEVEGVVTLPNGKQAFYFEKTDKEGINYMRQSDGYYPWQSAGYDNFYLYSAANVTKSGLWKINFKEDGHVELDNTQRGAGGFLLMFDGSYSTIGTYTGSKQDKKVLPYLYKDTAEPSKEVLTVPEKTVVLPSATTAEIKVKANCKWSVRNHDSWIKKFEPASGNGDGTVKVTFDANKTGEVRKAEFLFIGEETNVSSAFEQAVPVKNIKELIGWMTAKNVVYELDAKDVKVSYVSGNNFYLEDADAGVLLYSKGLALAAGDVINGTVSGSCTLYNMLPELTSMTLDAATVTKGTAPETELTLDALNKDYDKYISRRILVKDVEVSDGVSGKDDRDGKIKNGDVEFAVRSSDSKSDFTVGSKGSIMVFPAVRNNARQLSIYHDSFKPTYFVTTVTAKDLTVAKGNTVKVDIKTQTSAKPTFKSESDAIATVSAAGVVSGIAEGETTITVNYPADGVYSAAEASFKVTVTKESNLGNFTSNLSDAVEAGNYSSDKEEVFIFPKLYYALEVGTSKHPGEAKVTIPAGIKKIAFYAIAHKGQGETSIEIKDGIFSVYKKNINEHDGFTGNAPYNLGKFSKKNSKYYHEIVLPSATTKAVTLDIKVYGQGLNASIGLFFGINAE